MADLKRHNIKLTDADIANLMAEARGWRPSEGDEMNGSVLGVKIGTSTFGTYPIVFVLDMDDSEPVALHCFHTVLRNEMSTQRPERGDTLYVKYLGEKQDYDGPKGYSAPQMYAVLVTKPGAAARSVWDQLPTEPTNGPSGDFNDNPPFS